MVSDVDADIGVQVPRLDVDPFDVRHLREPYALQQQLRDAGPVVWLERMARTASPATPTSQTSCRTPRTSARRLA